MKTVDLFFREEDMDIETALQLIFSAVFTVVITAALCVVCLPQKVAKKSFLFSPKKVPLRHQ